MQKVINNKRYNTESSTRCGSAGTTALFKKRTGEFFLADETVGMVTPLTYEKAKRWAEQNGIEGAEQYFRFDPGKTVTSFSLPKMTVEQLKQVATARGETSSQVLADLIYEAYSRL